MFSPPIKFLSKKRGSFLDLARKCSGEETVIFRVRTVDPKSGKARNPIDHNQPTVVILYDRGFLEDDHQRSKESTTGSPYWAEVPKSHTAATHLASQTVLRRPNPSNRLDQLPFTLLPHNNPHIKLCRAQQPLPFSTCNHTGLYNVARFEKVPDDDAILIAASNINRSN